MADSIIDLPEVDATRQETIAAIVQRELQAQAQMAPLVFDASPFGGPGDKSVEFPKLDSFSVQKLSAGSRADAQAPTSTTDKLSFDQLATVQFILKKQATLQSKIAFEQEAIKRAASAHARQVDKDLLDEMIANAAAANAVTFNVADYEGMILSMKQKLDEQHAPFEDRFVIVRPVDLKGLLGVSNFVQADRYGTQTSALVRGELGMAYGFRFISSSILSTQFVNNVLVAFQKEGAALGFQMNPMVDEQKAIEYGAGSKRTAVDQLYGVKTLQLGKLISVAS